MNEAVLLRNQIAALTKERDEWMRSLEFSLKQRDKLTAERDDWKARCEFSFEQRDKLTKERDALTAKVASFESRIDRHVKTELALIVNNKSLKYAALLALDALEKSTPKPRKGDDDYCERGWRDQSSAITALKAVL